MKTLLKISVLLNIGLLCGWVFLPAAWRRAAASAAPPAQPEEVPSVIEPAVPATAVPAKASERPFNWSQLESSDYPTYIANLRSIGCPEQTIRDIIAADVESLYASQRQALENKLATGSVVGRTELQRELHQLGNQEASAVTALLAAPSHAGRTTSARVMEDPASGIVRQEPAGTVLGPLTAQYNAPSAFTLNPSTSAAALEPAPAASARKTPPATISLPLVLQTVDPAVVPLTPQQAQVVSDLRQKFVEDVGGPNQDPNDPAYSQRWQISQPQADLDLRGMIGIRAWEGYQMAAWAKAHEQTPSGP